jgi:hypothetical protein
MTATVLSQGGFDQTPESPYTSQDPNTGEIVRVWKKDTDPNTPGTQPRTIKCICKGVISKSARGAGTAEVIGVSGIIEETDYVLMKFAPSVVLTKRDRVTDISRKGTVVWKEEESTGLPTVFKVEGVTPMFDPFGNHIANHALLARADVQ